MAAAARLGGMLALTRANHFLHVTRAMEGVGLNLPRVFARHGLRDWRGAAPDDAIPLVDVFRTLEAGARETDDRRFGLIVGGHGASFDRFGTFGRLAQRTLGLGDVFQLFRRFVRYQTNVSRIWEAESRAAVHFCRAAPLPARGGELMEQYTLQVMLRAARLHLGPTWCPPKVTLQSPLAPEIEDAPGFSGVAVRYRAPVTSIEIPFRDIAAASAPASTFRSPLYTPAGTFADGVAELLGTLVHQRAATVAATAGVLGVSPRTLQRRLADEGASFRGLLDQARSELACRRLQDGDDPIGDIALDLGYSDAPHFVRAFRAWHGMTPGRWREERRAAALSAA